MPALLHDWLDGYLAGVDVLLSAPRHVLGQAENFQLSLNRCLHDRFEGVDGMLAELSGMAMM